MTLLQQVAENSKNLARVSAVYYSHALSPYRESLEIRIDNDYKRTIEVVESGYVTWGINVKGVTLSEVMTSICNIINKTEPNKAEWVEGDGIIDDDF